MHMNSFEYVNQWSTKLLAAFVGQINFEQERKA